MLFKVYKVNLHIVADKIKTGVAKFYYPNDQDITLS
jgi:hypothetical protein